MRAAGLGSVHKRGSGSHADDNGLLYAGEQKAAASDGLEFFDVCDRQVILIVRKARRADAG